jgi:hypothetical protein
MTDITNWLEDFKQRLECNTDRLDYAKKMLADAAVQLPDPMSDKSDILRSMDVWLGHFERASSERNDLKVELEEKRNQAYAAVARACAPFLDDRGQPNA